MKRVAAGVVFGCAVVFALLDATVAAGQVLAAGPGARVRMTITSALTTQQILAMAGIEPTAEIVSESPSTLSLRTADGLALVLPAAGVRLSGVLLDVRPNALIIKRDGRAESLTVPPAAIAMAERSVGRRSRGRYAGLGALTGLASGALLGLVSASQCRPNEWFCSAGINTLAGGILGAAAGAVVGAIVPPAERWSRIDVAAINNAQEPARTASFGNRRPSHASIAFQLGRASSGPARDIEQAMRTSGFGDNSPDLLGGTIASPSSHTGFGSTGFPVVFEFDYRVRAPWNVGVIVSRTAIGETDGFNRTAYQFITVEYAATTVAGLVTRNYGVLTIGAGPAVHSARTRTMNGGLDKSWSGDSHFGFIARGGVRTPAATRLYLDLNAQYRYIGEASYGPFAGSPPVNGGTALPRSSAQFNHWLVAFGPGIRF